LTTIVVGLLNNAAGHNSDDAPFDWGVLLTHLPREAPRRPAKGQIKEKPVAPGEGPGATESSPSDSL